ncbi:MarR family winged helix-turn-helix transcriptional regulator [Rhodoplanes roseus]|uniref:MarR family transcriptional regulator n=1 Tax=Rhodoplanes roseus TaxID=29409 RepID=A0A327KYS8_9BRAD|nr:MarR family transcriptional regulator [Rhodoplanes roseus]RAI42755.1 MarR family transcriptional regulator [Rhodoplanes roseus]
MTAKASAPQRAQRGKRAGAAARAPYDFREQVGHLLRRAYQRHVAIFQQNAADPQLTAVQFVTLCTLREQGPCSQSELVRATAVDQGTIRGIIDRLKARGLIVISSHGEDRRKVIVHLTPQGAAALDRMVPCAHDITELTMSGLEPVERVALVYLLRKMIGAGAEP